MFPFLSCVFLFLHQLPWRRFLFSPAVTVRLNRGMLLLQHHVSVVSWLSFVVHVLVLCLPSPQSAFVQTFPAPCHVFGPRELSAANFRLLLMWWPDGTLWLCLLSALCCEVSVTAGPTFQQGAVEPVLFLSRSHRGAIIHPETAEGNSWCAYGVRASCNMAVMIPCWAHSRVCCDLMAGFLLTLSPPLSSGALSPPPFRWCAQWRSFCLTVSAKKKKKTLKTIKKKRKTWCRVGAWTK